MQLLARLVFNRIRIALQTIYVAFEQLILSLQTMQLPLKRLETPGASAVVCRQAVLAEDNVITQPNRQHSRSSCCHLSPAK